MDRRLHILHLNDGHSLIELLVVVAVLGVCLAAGSVVMAGYLGTQQARGAAQSLQAAAATAQVGVLWNQNASEVRYDSGRVSVSQDGANGMGALDVSTASVAVSTNLARWLHGAGVSVTFGQGFASPDGGGSVYFQVLESKYRVTVRPESGLTVRSVVEPLP